MSSKTPTSPTTDRDEIFGIPWISYFEVLVFYINDSFGIYNPGYVVGISLLSVLDCPSKAMSMKALVSTRPETAGYLERPKSRPSR